MLLARDAGEQRDRADPATPAAREAEQPPTQYTGGEMLLGDGHLAATPALAELAQIGEEDVRQGRVEGRGSQKAVERRLCPRLVVASSAACSSARTSAGASSGGSSSTPGAPAAQRCGLGRGEPFGEVRCIASTRRRSSAE